MYESLVISIDTNQYITFISCGACLCACVCDGRYQAGPGVSAAAVFKGTVGHQGDTLVNVTVMASDFM